MWIKSSLIALGFACAGCLDKSVGRQQADAALLFRVPASRSGLPLSSLRPSGKDTIDRLNDPPIENGYAIRREILSQADAKLDGRIEKAFEIAHSASRKIMKYHDGPGLCSTLRERAFDPTVRVLPVARDRVPEDAGHPLRREHLDHCRIEQPLIKIAALPERAEKAVRVRENPDHLLGIADLL